MLRVVENAHRLAFLEAGRIGSGVRGNLVLLSTGIAETKDWKIVRISIAVLGNLEIDDGSLGRHRSRQKSLSASIEENADSHQQPAAGQQAGRNPQHGG